MDSERAMMLRGPSSYTTYDQNTVAKQVHGHHGQLHQAHRSRKQMTLHMANTKTMATMRVKRKLGTRSLLLLRLQIITKVPAFQTEAIFIHTTTPRFSSLSQFVSSLKIIPKNVTVIVMLQVASVRKPRMECQVGVLCFL